MEAAVISYGMPRKALGSAPSLQFAWFFRLLHHLLEGP